MDGYPRAGAGPGELGETQGRQVTETTEDGTFWRVRGGVPTSPTSSGVASPSRISTSHRRPPAGRRMRRGRANQDATDTKKGIPHRTGIPLLAE